MDGVAQSFWSLLLKGKNPPWGNACLWPTLQTDQVNLIWALRNESNSARTKAFTLFCVLWTKVFNLNLILTQIRFSQVLSRMKTTFMTLLFLLVMAYFSFAYTFRIIPECYCGCIVDTVTFWCLFSQSFRNAFYVCVVKL